MPDYRSIYTPLNPGVSNPSLYGNHFMRSGVLDLETPKTKSNRRDKMEFEMKHSLKTTAALLILSASLMSACAALLPNGANSEDDAVNLEGTSWTLTQISGIDLLDGSNAYFIFEEGQVQGNASCNQFSGSYEMDGSQLTFGPMMSTMMACEFLDQETTFLGAFGQPLAFRVDGEQLILSGEDGTDLLVFNPTQHASLENTDWKLTGYLRGTGFVSLVIGTEISATVSDGQISGSAGCNSYFGSANVDSDQISISGVGNTEMWCESPEGAMDQETDFLSALQNAVSFKIEAQRLTIFNAEGLRLMEFVAQAGE
jgi:heat shock protein HslJ